MENKHFQKLVDSGNPIGEVVAINRFLVTIRGLHPVNIRALVMFEDGTKGLVHRILEDSVLILNMGKSNPKIGTTCVVQHESLVGKVGKDFLGRVVSATGEPLDGKGPIAADGEWPVFNKAPGLQERTQLNTQLETGVTVIDSLFPLVKGQRIAMIGDSRSGKSSLAQQIATHQVNTDVVVVYCMIAKRRSDINKLLDQLKKSGSMKNTIVVVSTMNESPVLGYLAPYVACAMAEYLWQHEGKEVLLFFDDLTSHAYIYREIALLSGTSPGRESYPGDMFYAHASLLERAGKLKKTEKTLTVIPLVLSPGGDITGYIPTNLMSISDGQWVLDLKIFNEGIKPAVNTGLSVTRVGGRGHNTLQKQHAAQIFKALGAFAKAKEYSQFGSELALATRRDLELGKQIFSIMTQPSTETYSIITQQLMLDVLLGSSVGENLDVSALKMNAIKATPNIKKESDFKPVRDQVKQLSQLELKR
ncbi:MAG: sodium-transporting two-sector ATPase [bacterium]|nr:sodium-transporting two-sector ATPase [bacterium]